MRTCWQAFCCAWGLEISAISPRHAGKLQDNFPGTSGIATICIEKCHLCVSEADSLLCLQSPRYARCTPLVSPVSGKLGPAHSSSRHQDALQAAAVQEGGLATLPRPDCSPPAETQPQCHPAGKSLVCTSSSAHLRCTLYVQQRSS